MVLVEKLMKWVEEKLVPPMAKIGTQRHLLAIRNGVVSTLSLILIGTFLWSLSIYRFLDGMNLLPLIRQRLFYLLG